MNIVWLMAFFAAADPVGCPKTIQVKEQLAAPVAGWTAASDGMPHQLAGLTFFDGKPEEKASLAPDGEVTQRRQTISTWKFDKTRPTWVMCRYSGTGVTLTRELARNTSMCTVAYSRDTTIEGLPVIEKIDCR
jgi:hypothetical protein